MSDMRVLIYGGRDFTPDHDAWNFMDVRVLEYELADWDFDEIVIVSGGARGADTFGEDVGKKYGIRIEIYPAEWAIHGKAAGHIRNQEMLDTGIDIAVEFPGGRGTADMRKRLDAAGVKVIEYKETNAEANRT